MSEMSLDDELTPPAVERVAARALVLCSVAYRGMIEIHHNEPEAPAMLQEFVEYWRASEFAAEAEPTESEVVLSPLGQLSPQQGLDASWCAEPMAVLGWALGRVPMPPPYDLVDPGEVAGALGFPAADVQDLLVRSSPIGFEELEAFRQECLALHWRLRQFSLDGEKFNFEAYAAICDWDTMNVSRLDFLDGDLAVGDTPLDELGDHEWSGLMSMVQERHRAANWLLGGDPVYSLVGTDT